MRFDFGDEQDLGNYFGGERSYRQNPLMDTGIADGGFEAPIMPSFLSGNAPAAPEPYQAEVRPDGRGGYSFLDGTPVGQDQVQTTNYSGEMGDWTTYTAAQPVYTPPSYTPPPEPIYQPEPVYQPEHVYTPQPETNDIPRPPDTVTAPPPQIGGFLEPTGIMNPNNGIADETGFYMSLIPETPISGPSAPVVTPQPAPSPPPAPVAAPMATPAPVAPTPVATPVSQPAPAPTPTASPTMATATTSNIDPTIQPYLSYGLQEAQKLYQGGGPQYYGGQTYVSPSQATQTGLQALEQRASQGSPLTGAAQGQLQNTIQGGYLQGNPFFQGAFNPAAQAAESKFKTTLGDIGSAASKAGRYGSGAMNTMQQGASGQFAKALSDTAGSLAYQNYDAERTRQQAATMAAPSMASADYNDIQNMLKAGQMREGYTGAQQQADIAKFNYQQTQPQQNLTNFLSGVYGNPLTRAQQVSSSAPEASGWQNLLGGAATAAGIYKNIGGTKGLSEIGNWLTGGG